MNSLSNLQELEQIERDHSKAIEKANSYRQMMGTWAWKDFKENILDATRKQALEQAVFSSRIEDVQIQRGVVKAIDGILSSVGFILDGV